MINTVFIGFHGTIVDVVQAPNTFCYNYSFYEPRSKITQMFKDKGVMTDLSLYPGALKAIESAINYFDNVFILSSAHQDIRDVTTDWIHRNIFRFIPEIPIVYNSDKANIITDFESVGNCAIIDDSPFVIHECLNIGILSCLIHRIYNRYMDSMDHAKLVRCFELNGAINKLIEYNKKMGII